MSLNAIGDLGDPKKDAAAFQPVLDELADRVMEKLVPALNAVIDHAIAQAKEELLNGLTITVEKKQPSRTSAHEQIP